jgi:hypothetical protein
MGENARSLRWTKEVNDQYPAAAKYLKEERKARKLFIGHMGVTDLATLQATREARRAERREAKALANKEPYKLRKAEIQRKYRAKKAQRIITALGPSTQQAAPPDPFWPLVTHQVGHPDADHADSSTQQAALPATRASQSPPTIEPTHNIWRPVPSQLPQSPQPAQQCEVIQKPLTFTHSSFSSFRTTAIQPRIQHNIWRPVPGQFSKLTAPITTRQHEVIQSPLTFTHSSFSSFRTDAIRPQTQHNI